MTVTAGFLGGYSDAQLTDFYLDEMGKETAGELNRFDMLVRYGADYWYNRVKANDYWVSNDNGVSSGAIKKYHRSARYLRLISMQLILLIQIHRITDTFNRS